MQNNNQFSTISRGFHCIFNHEESSVLIPRMHFRPSTSMDPCFLFLLNIAQTSSTCQVASSMSTCAALPVLEMDNQTHQKAPHHQSISTDLGRPLGRIKMNWSVIRQYNNRLIHCNVQHLRMMSLAQHDSCVTDIFPGLLADQAEGRRSSARSWYARTSSGCDFAKSERSAGSEQHRRAQHDLFKIPFKAVLPFQ